MDILRGAREPLLSSIEVFDIFTDPTGEKVPVEMKSVGYALTYCAADRTLTSDEVTTAHAALKDRLQTTRRPIARVRARPSRSGLQPASWPCAEAQGSAVRTDWRSAPDLSRRAISRLNPGVRPAGAEACAREIGKRRDERGREVRRGGTENLVHTAISGSVRRWIPCCPGSVWRAGWRRLPARSVIRLTP